MLWFAAAALCGQAKASTVDGQDLSPPEESIPERARGLDALLQRDPNAALRSMERWAAESPREAEALFWLGYARLRTDQVPRAIQALRESEKLGSRPGLDKVLGVTYYAAGQHLLFRRRMERALQSTPSDPAPYYFLGRYFDSVEQNYEEAAANFEQFLAERPDHPHANHYLGFAYERLGRLDEARERYQRAGDLADRLEPGFAEPWIGLAKLDLLEGEPGSAAAPAEEAVRRDPASAEGHRTLAEVYGILGKSEEAIREWQTVARLDPTDPGSHYRLYRAWLSAGEPEKAAAALADYELRKRVYGVR